MSGSKPYVRKSSGSKPRRRARRALYAFRPRGPQPRFGRAMIAFQFAAAIAFVAFLLSLDGVRSPFAPPVFEIHAQFSDAAGLRTENHSPVTVAGVPMGQVSNVSYEDGLAVATLALDPEAAGRIPAGSSVRIIPRAALQDLMVDIEPAEDGGEPLSSGATITAADTSSTVATDRVLAVLDADTRAQTQILLNQLGAGLRNRGGDLATDLDRLSRLVDSSTEVTTALAERRQLLTRFVDELDVVFTQLASRRRQLAGAVESGAQTLRVTAQRDSELAAAVDELPSTLARTRGALDAITELGRPLEPALTELLPAARALPGTLSGLRDITPPARELLAAVEDLAVRGREPVRALRGALEGLGPAAEAARPGIPDISKIVAAIDKNKEGIGVLGDRFTGVFSTNDVNGPILRGLGFFEPFDPANLGFSSSASGAELNAAKADTVKALTEVCLKENPVACLVRYLVPTLPGSVVEGEGG